MADSPTTVQPIQSANIAEWLDTLPARLQIGEVIYTVGDLIDLSDDQCIVRLKSAAPHNGHALDHPFTLFVLGAERLARMPAELRAAQPPAAAPIRTAALESADITATQPSAADATRPSTRYAADEAFDDLGTGAETKLDAAHDAAPANPLRIPRTGSVLQRPASSGPAAGSFHYLLFDDQPGLEWQDWFQREMREAGLAGPRDALQPRQIPAFLKIVDRAMAFLFDAFECLAAENIVWQNIGPLFLIPDPAADGGYRMEITGLRRFRPAPGAGYPERTWHRLYAAPETHSGNGLTPKSDVFTAGIALYTMLTGVDTRRWEIGGDAQMLPNVRTYWRHCPAGILPVLQDLLRHEEPYRPSLPDARQLVAAALKKAASERLYRNDAVPAASSTPAVRTFESSAMTLNGWVKELRAQQARQGMIVSRPNQDAAFLSERVDNVLLSTGPAGAAEAAAPACLAVVADGISTCRFGRGELASDAVVNAYSEVWRLWLDGLRAGRWTWENDPTGLFAGIFLNRFSLEQGVEAAAGRFMHRFSFPHLVAECIRRATLKIWSLVGDEVKASPTADPAEIMGSTMIAAFVHGSRLCLANLGDSRAYLVSPGADPEQLWTIECLTADHDEKNRLFREEQAMPQHMLGLSGLESLTNGIGSLVTTNHRPGSRSGLPRRGENPDRFRASGAGPKNDEKKCDSWRPAYHRLTPDFYALRVRPQDILILCSDGLIDERAALMPQEAAEIVTEFHDAPADHLAMQLVKAANDIQEWPSKGDNITAVVLKFHG